MSKKRKITLGVAIVVVLAAAGIITGYMFNANSGKVAPYPAPGFELTTPQGEAVRLSDYKGKTPVVMVFWASWCPDCRNEMPHVYKVESEFDPSEVTILTVNSTSGVRETEEAALSYLEDNGLNFRNVLLDLEGEAASLYELSFIPTTVFIDRDGNVVARYNDEIGEKQLRREIKSLLKS